MKKLLALVLVLFMAAMVNAAVIQLKVDGVTDGAANDTEVDALSATITVHCDTDATAYDYYFAIATPGEDGGDYGTVTKLNAAGGDATVGVIIDGTSDGFIHITDISAADTSEPITLVAGNHFEVTLTRTGSAVQIDLLDDALNVVDSVTLVPEPMTILLLGLGGLFLRRR